MMSLISLFVIIGVVIIIVPEPKVTHPKTLLWIPASAVDAAAVNARAITDF